MTEKEILDKIKNAAKSFDAKYLRLQCTTAGIPDCVIYFADKNALFIEVKTKKDILSEPQKEFLNHVDNSCVVYENGNGQLGYMSFVADNITNYIEFLEKCCVK